MTVQRDPERLQTIVIGGGQAGLAVGYHLARHGLPFVILDANERVGDSWRKRWDSLRLFTPAQFDALPGMRVPAPNHAFITKDEMADYLETYAQRFALPVRTGTRVDRLSRDESGFVVTAGDRTLHAEQVVVAMSNYQQPRVPEFARDLAPDIVQVHSIDYRNPGQLQNGGVLVVGAGNSGAEIAIEVAREHPTWLSGRSTGQLPFRIDGRAARLGLVRFVLRVLFHRVLTLRSPLGRRFRAKLAGHGGPLIRLKAEDLAAAGIVRVPRVSGVQDGRPRLEDGRVLDVANVIWCTGFHPGFSWIDLPVLQDGRPAHDEGIVPSEPGLYFVGLEFLSAASSVMIHGVGRDAARIADAVAARARSRAPVSAEEPALAAA